MATSADKIAAALRPIAPQGKLLANDVPLINQMAAQWDARATTALSPVTTMDPAWVTAARSMIGQKEIPGSKNNPWIATGWQRLGAAWYNDDETPWCGFFVAWALDQAKLSYPKNFPSAKSFATHGTACAAQVGAIGVKSRKGGNHVFIIVGQTADKMYYKALGGNQSNMVNIMDILKTDVDDIRWPAGVPVPKTAYLPIMPKGKISVNEA
jgi:uncharacterized protein (TIGR02594 family)